MPQSSAFVITVRESLRPPLPPSFAPSTESATPGTEKREERASAWPSPSEPCACTAAPSQPPMPRMAAWSSRSCYPSHHRSPLPAHDAPFLDGVLWVPIVPYLPGTTHGGEVPNPLG